MNVMKDAGSNLGGNYLGVCFSTVGTYDKKIRIVHSFKSSWRKQNLRTTISQSVKQEGNTVSNSIRKRNWIRKVSCLLGIMLEEGGCSFRIS